VPDGTSVPEASESDERVVWVVKDNTLQPKLVKIGTTNGVNTQIISGLSENEVLAIDYSTSAVAVAEEETSTETSPFAPQPPGSKKK
jgi:HlyD family secretion protein